MRKQTDARVVDMTQGNPMKLILAFAIPLFIGTIFQQIYTTVDTMVVGHVLGDAAISAIGATSAIHALLFNLAISLNNGFAIITTQAFGERNEEKLRRSVAGMFVLNVLSILVLSLFGISFLRPIMHFMNTPAEVFEQAYGYVLILLMGLFSTVGYNMFASILRAVGNSRTPLYCLMVSSVVNIVLDILFVAVFSMGLAGAALATVLAQILSTVLCGAAFFKNYKTMIPKKEDILASRTLWGSMLSTGCAMALMLCVVNIGSIVFSRACNALGQMYIAAHTASIKVIMLLSSPQGTLATACSTFISQNWGARAYARIKQALRQAMALEAGWGLVGCAIVALCGRGLVWLITGTESQQILDNAVLHMNYCVSGLPALGVLLCLRTSMQSMGLKVAPVLSSCVELLMKSFGAWFMIPAMGYMGVCINDPLTWIIMTVFLLAAYLMQRKHVYPPTVREK